MEQSREELAVIASEVLHGRADEYQRRVFMEYVSTLEQLLDGLDAEEALGTGGWKNHIGLDKGGA